MRRTVLLFALAFSCSCGGSQAPADGGSIDAGSDAPTAADAPAGCVASATVNGTMLGMTLDAKDAIASFGDPASGGFWGFTITDYAGACADVQANDSVKSSELVGFEYQVSPTPTIGTYSVGDTTPFQVQFETFDATCNATDDMAIGGTVTITALTSSCISATFDLTFGGSAGNANEHVTGSVTAPVCAVSLDGGSVGCK